MRFFIQTDEVLQYLDEAKHQQSTEMEHGIAGVFVFFIDQHATCSENV